MTDSDYSILSTGVKWGVGSAILTETAMTLRRNPDMDPFYALLAHGWPTGMLIFCAVCGMGLAMFCLIEFTYQIHKKYKEKNHA
ncbi:MAG: hypothetical protein NWE79_02445 [Candidatus Bathyarchaeota archaeon]|nr:hypothetical protein [Candidatus Bathyarchaeota archaeon]